MAGKGYRLVDAGKITYTFEKCQPNQFQYAVEFIAHHGLTSAREYRSFLQGIGYKVLYKNINLKFSIGKVKWRPYGKGVGQITTSPGTYNKELLIVEKPADGKPFELHTSNADKATYYKPLRNAWLSTAVLLLVLSICQFITVDSFTLGIAIFGILGLICLIPTFKYQKKFSFYTNQASLNE